MMDPMAKYNNGAVIDAEQLVRDKQAMAGIENAN